MLIIHPNNALYTPPQHCGESHTYNPIPPQTAMEMRTLYIDVII